MAKGLCSITVNCDGIAQKVILSIDGINEQSVIPILESIYKLSIEYQQFVISQQVRVENSAGED